jgi:general secretion pathway protein I
VNGQRGFTLIEVLVAFAILSATVVMAVQGFAQGLRLLKLSGDHQHAALLADQKARELVMPTEGREDGTEGAYTWERVVRELPAPDLVPANQVPRWRVYEIAVQVGWGDSNRRSVGVTTLRTVRVADQNATAERR